MSYLLWLSGAVALIIWKYGDRIRWISAHHIGGEDLGMVSERWLRDYRCETHQDG